MQDERWQAVVTCDASYDGKFYYAVETTGIFCRPSCKSRTPNPNNVRFFQNREEALRHRFRPCKRCKPDQLQGPEEELVEGVKQLLQHRQGEPLTLGRIAEELHVSPSHLHHTFKRLTGSTPAEMLRDARLVTAKQLLAQTDASIATIAGSVGYASIAHFSTVFRKHVGMSPTEFRNSSSKETP